MGWLRGNHLDTKNQYHVKCVENSSVKTVLTVNECTIKIAANQEIYCMEEN